MPLFTTRHKVRGAAALNELYIKCSIQSTCINMFQLFSALSWNSTRPTRTPTSSPTSARRSSRGCRRVRRLPRLARHEPDTHDDPRRLVRRPVRLAARFSSRGCPVRDARVYTCTVHDRRIPNVGVGVRVGVGPLDAWVPWLSACRSRPRS